MPNWSTAQNRQPTTEFGDYSIGGNAGFITEAYDASGISARRPGTSAQVFANAYAISSSLRYDLDLLLSTEDDPLRQSMNRLSLSAQYKEYKGTLGDFSPRFNKYSLNGSTIRGLLLEYQPQEYIATFAIGRTRRSLFDGSNLLIRPVIRRPALDRNLFAGRIGYGQQEENHFHLVGLVSRDKPSDFEEYSTAPAENVSISPEFGLHLLNKRLVIEGQLTASAFSADTRNRRISDSGVPGMLGFFTPRLGSRLDYASYLQARYTLVDLPESLEAIDQLTLLASYDRVAPGFVSLGRPYIYSDQAVFRFQPQFRMLDRRLSIGLDLTTRKNNLDDTRSATLRRNQLALTTQAQISPNLFLNAVYLFMGNRNTPVRNNAFFLFDDQRIVTNTLILSPVFTLPRGGINHILSLTTVFQGLSDKSDSRSQTTPYSLNVKNFTSTLHYNAVLLSGLSIQGSTSVVRSDASTSDTRALGLTAGASYGFLERRLHAGATIGLSRTSVNFLSQQFDSDERLFDELSTSQYTLTLHGTFRVTDRDILRLNVRGLKSGGFREIQSTLRFEHRF